MIFVAEIQAHDGSSAVTLYYGTIGFATKPTDTPANTYIAGRLRQPGNYSRALNAEIPIGLVTTGYGECTLINADGDLDALMRYGVANRTFTLRGKDTEGGAYPADWTTLFTCSMDRIEPTGRELRIFLRDGAKSFFDVPVCTTFLGTGGLEGDSTLSGAAKPRVYGEPFNASPVRISYANNIFMTSDKPYCFSQPTFDGRSVVTHMASTFNDAANYAALVALAVPAGQMGLCSDSSIFKLGSVATYPVTADPVRYDSAYTGRRRTLAQCLTDVATDAGLSGGQIDSGMSSMGNAGYYIADTSTTYTTVIDELCRSVAAYASFTSAGVFTAAVFTVPSGTQVWDFTQSNARLDSVKMLVPYQGITVSGPRNFTQLPLTSSSAVNTDEWRNAISKEYLYAETYTGVQAKHSKPSRLQVNYVGYHNNSFSNNKPSGIELSGQSSVFSTLFCSERDVVDVSAKISAAMVSAIDIGSVVKLTLARYSYDSGVLFRVTGIRYEMQSQTVTYTLWR